jgi:hypothetical protein
MHALSEMGNFNFAAICRGLGAGEAPHIPVLEARSSHPQRFVSKQARLARHAVRRATTYVRHELTRLAGEFVVPLFLPTGFLHSAARAVAVDGQASTTVNQRKATDLMQHSTISRG